MTPRPIDIPAAETPPSRLDAVIEALLVTLLGFAPLAFGAVEPWSEMVVVALAGLMLLCLALKWLHRPGPAPAWAWSYVPVAGLILIALVQLAPLPAGLVGAVSPQTLATKRSLLGDLPDAGSALKAVTISFYPHATRHDLRLALAVAGVFFVVVNVFRRADQVRRLLTAITVIGAGVALLALAQVVTGADGVYWTVPSPYGRATAGSFLHHSHYSQFMNLSIGAALGLLVVRLHGSFRAGRPGLSQVVEHLVAARAIWLLAAVIVVAAATVVLSLSRAGCVSLLIGGAATAIVLAWKRALKAPGWIMAAVALAALLCVLYVGFDAVYDRLATLADFHERYASRWQIVRDVALAWTKFPVLGTGLGTHAVVYPMFDRSAIPALAGHAENEYAQLAEEAGSAGLVMLVAFAALIARRYAQCLRRPGVPIRSACFGLGLALVAILVHSFSDFGQHVPANACLTAVFCGLLVSLARMRSGSQRGASTSATAAGGWPRRALAGLALVGIVGAWGWVLLGADRARRGQAHWARALTAERRLARRDWQGSNEQYAALIRRASAAADCEPENVTYRHWLNVYRWRSISRARDPNTHLPVVTPRIRQLTGRIVGELHEARKLCPTFGATCCVVGQLEKGVLGRPIGAAHIRLGRSLAPCDPTACFVAGCLAVQEGRASQSVGTFRRALELDRRLFGDVMDVCLRQAGRPDLALAVAEADPHWLGRLAELLDERGETGPCAAEARARAIATLKRQCRQPDAPTETLAAAARACLRDGQRAFAIACYRRALERDYGQVRWRLELARALADVGRTPAALHEARVCLRLRPQMEAARQLIADISARSAGGNE